MNFLNWLYDFFYGLELFGIKPFRALFTLLDSPIIWAFLIGTFLLVLVIKKVFGKAIFAIIAGTIKLAFSIVMKLAKAISSRILDIYMYVKIKKEANEKGFLWSEYWANRKVTVKGIYSVDATGATTIVIPYENWIQLIVNACLKVKKVVSNILLFTKGMFKII